MTQTRRDWIRMSATAAAGMAGTGWAADPPKRRTLARQNLKLAVFSGVYAGLPLAEAARRIRADGFAGVILENQFADARFDWTAPDWGLLRRITDTLEAEQLKIAGLYGYYNLVDPDVARREKGEARMKFLIENWRQFHSPIIATETGTLNAKSEWLESPDNRTEAAFAACAEAIERWTTLAETTGAIVAIEPYWRNIIDSSVRAERLFRDLPSKALGLIMDPCNYFRNEDLPNMSGTLRDIFKRVGKRTVLAHAKDVKESAEGTDLPAAGQGRLDYPLYLGLLADLKRPIYLALEHLTLDDVPRARDYVSSQFERIS